MISHQPDRRNGAGREGIDDRLRGRRQAHGVCQQRRRALPARESPGAW